jgi:hypothetical protein
MSGHPQYTGNASRDWELQNEAARLDQARQGNELAREGNQIAKAQYDLAEAQIQISASQLAAAHLANMLLGGVLASARELCAAADRQESLLRDLQEAQKAQLDVGRQLLAMQQAESMRTARERDATELVHQCRRLAELIEGMSDPVSRAYWARRQQQVVTEAGLSTRHLPRLEDKQAFDEVVRALHALEHSDDTRLTALVSDYFVNRKRFLKMSSQNISVGLPPRLPELSPDYSKLDHERPSPPMLEQISPQPETIAKFRELLDDSSRDTLVAWAAVPVVAIAAGLIAAAVGSVGSILFAIVASAAMSALFGTCAVHYRLNMRIGRDDDTRQLLRHWTELQPDGASPSSISFKRAFYRLEADVLLFRQQLAQWKKSYEKQRKDADQYLTAENTRRRTSNRKIDEAISVRRERVEQVRKWLVDFHRAHPEMGSDSEIGVTCAPS